MERNTENRIDAARRFLRERAFWDRVYGNEGQGSRHYSWMEFIGGTTYSSRFFRGLLRDDRARKILSIGGGVDHLGLVLAVGGDHVVCVDISPVAAARTSELAERAGVADRLTTVAASCEEVDLPGGDFDVVVCKRALHHMDVSRVLIRVHDSLMPGGVFLAEEPICLSAPMRWVHRRLPFYGDAPHTPDERELNADDLEAVRRIFLKTDFYYFDLVARESVAFMLARVGMGLLLDRLGRLDYWLLNRTPLALKAFANYVVIRAYKSG